MKQYTINHIKLSLIYSIAAVMTATTVSSCQKDEVDIVDLTAYVADDYAGDAKVSIDASQYACWETGDEVNVNGKSYPVTVSGSYKTATIVGVEKDDNSDYTAVYPASCAGVVTPGSTTVDITLPSTQTWDASHIFSPMVATYNGSQLNFHNPCNLLAVTVTNKTGSTLMVHSIIVESTVNNITGTFTVSGCNDANPTTTYTGSDGGKTITLDCGNQSVDNSAVFYVSVPKVEGETFHFSVNAKTVVNTTTTKYTFAKNSRSLTIMNNQFVPITVATDDAAVTNDPYFWGKGSDTYPYLITDYNDLKSLSYVVHNATDDAKYNAANRYYLQTGNFTITDANWGSSDRLAVGSTTNAFKANYDGGNHTISFYGVTSAESSYPVGVFGVVRGGASISNLTVAGSIDLGDSYGDVDAGGVAGKATGKVTFSSCTNQATVTSTYTTAADYGVGGICGAVNATDATVTFTSCTNSAQIKAYGLKNGGIVGLSTAGTLNFSSCTNSGDIVSFDGSSTYYDDCGGIIAVYAASANTISLTGCSNSGPVTGKAHVAGIVGRSGGTTNVSGRTSNSAAITGTDTEVAGIIGYVENNKTLTISGGDGNSTTNSGDVQGAANVAGIIGLTDGATSLSRCYNEGEVTIISSSTYTNYGDKNYYGVAGILARIRTPNSTSYTLTVNYCKNTGAIQSAAKKSSFSIGGIVGYVQCYNTTSYSGSAMPLISNSYNTGRLSADELYVGGIVGSGICCVVANCYNEGNIIETVSTTSRKGGGIFGYSYGTTNYYSFVNNCYNTGTFPNTTRTVTGNGRTFSISLFYEIGSSSMSGANAVQGRYSNGYGATTTKYDKGENGSYNGAHVCNPYAKITASTGDLSSSVYIWEYKQQDNRNTGSTYSYLRDALQAWCTKNSSYAPDGGWSTWSDDAIPTFDW